MARGQEQAAVLRELDQHEAAGRQRELLDLALRAKASWGYDPAFMGRFAEVMQGSLAYPELVFVAAESGDGLVGFATVVLARDPAWLEDLWVDPGHQGGGLGTALLAVVVDRARAAGATALEWESDPNAEPFYLARGARRVSVHPSSIDPARLLPTMRLDLPRE